MSLDHCRFSRKRLLPGMARVGLQRYQNFRTGESISILIDLLQMLLPKLTSRSRSCAFQCVI